MHNDTPQDEDLLDTSGPAPGIFESMGMTPVSAQSLSLLTPQEPSSISGGGDRELLERAAKAAGIELDGKFSTTDRMSVARGGFWNPLVDDGDALRLAVKLHISIGFIWDGENDQYDPVTAHRGSAYADEQIGITERDEFDEPAATRRAIVRAAASLTNPTEVSP